MRTQPVTAEYYQDKHRKEMLGATVIGGLSGYAAKYAFPPSTSEYDTYVTNAIKTGIKHQIEGTRAETLRNIRKDAGSEIAESLNNFLMANKANIIHDKKDSLKEALNKLDGTTKQAAKELLSRVDDAGAEAAITAQKTTQAAVKSLRPALLFIAIGAAIATSIVTLKNTLTRPEIITNRESFSKTA